MHQKSNSSRRFNAILPITPSRQNYHLLRRANHWLQFARPVLPEGRTRNRHGRWVQDAMDAFASPGVRRWERTAKACGPDTPTLVSSFAGPVPAKRRGLKSPVPRGERAINRKTIAQETPGRIGVPVVTNSRVFYHCTRGCGCTLRPVFPAPSDSRRETVRCTARAKSRRGGVGACLQLFEN
jgi:hypothetical protein